ncbi:MAG: UDP-N-acetylglucosamine 1-carboxyvinyltransferase [Proteobacteria bacterium]|nr:MAG: UDP-N-acetylglucosamine 1-carboxyvinyltransferase [Pseudomonadota bacterium]
MSEYLEIIGGARLSGTVRISGAKNAALPLMLASLLTPDEIVLENVPNLEDVSLTLRLLEHFGAETAFEGGRVTIKAERLLATEASYSLVKALRASFWVLAPLLARGGAARVALPGGDIIGARPVDIHLDGLAKMGADLTVKHGVVYAAAPRGLKPARIELRFPSVGATHQLMMAAALVSGTTTIEGAAREPEVVALANLLNAMGAEIEGAGSSKIIICGKRELGGATQRLIGDRIEAGTYLLAGLATGGEVEARGIDPAFLGRFLNVLQSAGVYIETGQDFVRVKRGQNLIPITVSTGPFPELATDLQAPLLAFLSVIPGESRIEETVFEGRFGHISELCRMGARITVEELTAVVNGVEKLSGAPVDGHDIRAAASLVIAGVAADGVTQIFELAGC